MTAEELEYKLAELSPFVAESDETVQCSFLNYTFYLSDLPHREYGIFEDDERFDIRFTNKTVFSPMNYKLIIPNCDKDVILNYEKKMLDTVSNRDKPNVRGYFILKSKNQVPGD